MRLGNEQGIGRTTKKNEQENLQSRASVQRPDYPDHGPVLSGGGSEGSMVQCRKNKDLEIDEEPKVDLEVLFC